MLGGIVRGKIADLRTPTEADLPALNAWMADVRVRRGGHVWEEPAGLATWKERLKEAAKDHDAVLWMIEAEGRAVGLARVTLHRETPMAEMDQFVIDAEVWGRGIGSDAALALHRYLFDHLDRRVCVTEMPADNERALRVAGKLGYREFGRGHDVYYRDGAYVDQVALRFDRSVWDERWGATEREYGPSSDLDASATASAPRSARPGDRSEPLTE